MERFAKSSLLPPQKILCKHKVDITPVLCSVKSMPLPVSFGLIYDEKKENPKPKASLRESENT